MKNNLSVLTLILVALWLVSGLACGSQNQNNVNSTNIYAGNGNSNANVPPNNSSAKTDRKDPKEVCAYLSEFPAGEYKPFSGDYKCESEKEESLAGGKRRVWHYHAIGTTGYIKWIEFRFSSNGTDAENLKGEKHFVELMETFWQKAFAAPLPDNIKAELLSNKGKRAVSIKRFSDPVSVTINHVDTGDKVYGLQIEVDMCNLCK